MAIAWGGVMSDGGNEKQDDDAEEDDEKWEGDEDEGKCCQR